MPKSNYKNPNHSYTLEELLKFRAEPAPDDFDIFWQSAYLSILNFRPQVQLQDTQEKVNNWSVIDVRYSSTNGVMIGGWLLVPTDKPPTRGLIIGHGYSGRNAPDFSLPFPDAALFFPCCRGLGRSTYHPVSAEPKWHVLHDIDKKDRYIIKGCVEDIWVAVTCMELLFPFLKDKLGFLGVSFTGGVGVLAMACEERISRAHFNVPTFGHHRFRLRQATWGSGHSLQEFFQKEPRLTINTLRYYDAANAAELIKIPVHYSLALKDPVVTPPGQFAIYNNNASEKHLFIFDEGHAPYPRQHEQERQLLKELETFFAEL